VREKYSAMDNEEDMGDDEKSNFGIG